MKTGNGEQRMDAKGTRPQDLRIKNCRRLLRILSEEDSQAEPHGRAEYSGKAYRGRHGNRKGETQLHEAGREAGGFLCHLAGL